MSNTEYYLAGASERDAIIDFANYVFSQAHCPHDFKVLLPKAYGDGAANFPDHFVAKRDGLIRGMVAMQTMTMRVLDARLTLGFVGTVSVHPYARGEGHMKRLMADMTAEAARRNYDLLMLGGLRQRYNYYGFEQSGYVIHYDVTATNLRHCLKGVDVSNITFSELTDEHPDEVDFAWKLAAGLPVACDRDRGEFVRIMHSWNNKARLIRMDGEPVGYAVGAISEIVLTDEALLPKVIKALMEQEKLDKVSLGVSPHEKERIRMLTDFAENRSIHMREMIRVLNWENVLSAYLSLKAGYMKLDDGCVTVSIDGEGYALAVQDGKASVRRTDAAPEIALTGMEAQRLFFRLESALCPDPRFGNWLPLPLPISSVDGF